MNTALRRPLWSSPSSQSGAGLYPKPHKSVICIWPRGPFLPSWNSVLAPLALRPLVFPLCQRPEFLSSTAIIATSSAVPCTSQGILELLS